MCYCCFITELKARVYRCGNMNGSGAGCKHKRRRKLLKTSVNGFIFIAVNGWRRGCS